MYAPDYQLRQELIQEELRTDNKTAKRLRTETIKKFRQQLMTGSPFNEDEKGLRQLPQQGMTQRYAKAVALLSSDIGEKTSAILFDTAKKIKVVFRPFESSCQNPVKVFQRMNKIYR